MAAAQAPAHVVLDWSFNYGAAASSSALGPNSTFQYCPVKLTANDMEVAPSSSAGVTITASTRSVGILQNAPGLNQAATVRMLGISKCVVDGTTPIYPGSWLISDASGRGAASSSASAEVFGFALQGSTVANDIISVFVVPAGRW